MVATTNKCDPDRKEVCLFVSLLHTQYQLNDKYYKNSIFVYNFDCI